MFNSVKRMRLIGFVVWTLLLLAAVVSATHIVETAHKLGLHDWQAFTAPALIDVVAVAGKLSMATCFTHVFRRSGFRLLMAGGTVSLACNVYAGSNLGERAFGVLVVGAFMLLEHHATKASRESIVPVVVKPEPKVTKVTEAEKAARKRAGYQMMDAAAKTAWTRTYRERIAKRAPVSPGRVPVSELNVDMAMSE